MLDVSEPATPYSEVGGALTTRRENALGLRELHLKGRYRTGRDNLVRDFYVPILSEATNYRRAVGYFSSGSLALAAQGLNRLIERDGSVQLVASPQLTDDDLAALQRGMAARDDVVERALLRNLVAARGSAQQQRLEYLAWMVAEERLEMRIALMQDSSAGIFHEKFGLVTDGTCTVAFSGSANETEAAHARNFESFSVYRGWMSVEADWVEEFAQDFDSLWDDSTPELDVIDLPAAIADGIIRLAPRDWYSPPPDPEEERGFVHDLSLYPMGIPQMPNSLHLREYQKNAIRAWFDSGGKGIFELATGTGKTITALALMQRLSGLLEEHHDRPLVVLITVPFLNLASQWKRELASFGVSPILAMQDAITWRSELSNILEGVRLGSIRFAAIVTTNRTLAGRSFQGLIDQFPANTLVVADEVHNVGTQRLHQSLPATADYRLGLSATPERWMDELGSELIKEYFGEVVAQKSLQEAIDEGFLSEYDYFPVVVQLDEDEREKYLELSEKIARLSAVGSDELTVDSSEGPLKMLLFQRARLVGAARNKLPAILGAVEAHKGEGKIIVYCSDASELQADSGSPLEKQLEQIVSGLNLPPVAVSAAPYTYQVSPASRSRLERQFAGGVIDALVAIRCLDEGVDIPSMQTAIIAASTTNPRQFIQRRGRVLRKAPGKTHATIYDLVVSPGDPSELSDAVFNVERRLFRKELARVVEFARSARNRTEALHDLLPLREAWNSLDV